MPKTKPKSRANRNASWWQQLTKTPTLQPVSLRDIWPHMLLITVALTAWYGWCAPRSVALEDDGEFITVAWLFGVAHPPGYPLFTWLSHPFTWLPFGDVAWRVHLFSGFCGGLACAVLFWISRLLMPGNSIAYLAAFGAGLSRVFWSQAIIAEIYTLNALLYALAFALTLLFLRQGGTRWFCAALFVYGLGLSNHWPLIVLATPGLALLLLPRLRESIAALHKALPFFLLGLVPYLWMWWRANTAPELSFYGELGTANEFEHYILRKGYSGVDNSAAADFADKFSYYLFQAKELLLQYTPVGFVLIAIGFVAQWRRFGWAVSLAMTAALLSATYLLLSVLNFDYEYRKQVVFQVYPVIPYLTMGLWLGLGLDTLKNWLAERTPRATAIATIVGGVVIVANVVWHLPQNDRHDYDHARDYATTVLETLEPDAVAIVHADVNTTTLGYFHFVEGLRPDITLLNSQGIGQSPDHRLFHPVRAPALGRDELLAKYAEAEAKKGRPVYFFGPEPFRLSVDEYGVYKRLSFGRNAAGGPISTFKVNDTLLDLYRRIAERENITDAWTWRHRNTIINVYARWLTYMVYFHSDAKLRDRFRGELDQFAKEHYLAALLRLSILISRDRLDKPDELRAWLQDAQALINDRTNKSDAASVHHFAGELERKLNNEDAAIAHYKHSLDVYAAPSNPASTTLAKLYADRGDCDHYVQLRNRYLLKHLEFPKEMLAHDRRMQRRCRSSS